ncbi:lipoprotein [Desulfonatronospira thiodismutans ASO3-1]|uniref:Lipoprotein n=1 Tax=Desulfonatronospira thiodismutans ASO3-1 TaxID=555779 RepID=D6SN80_9BACT|nr:BspA family leucine-rich repeat surface protein [Desulfonatronospira thiodismutans]EFI34206.1 lipoprotein [Desulfonatronospira thiodismutans ASO3-1]
MSIQFNQDLEITLGTPFTDLFANTDEEQTSWYRLWTGKLDNEGEVVRGAMVGGGWVSKDGLEDLTVGVDQAGHNTLYVQTYTDEVNAWEHSTQMNFPEEIPFELAIEKDVVSEDTMLSDMFSFDTPVSSNEVWFQVKVDEEPVDTALGHGWVRGDRLGDEYFTAEHGGKELEVTPFYAGELHTDKARTQMVDRAEHYELSIDKAYVEEDTPLSEMFSYNLPTGFTADTIWFQVKVDGEPIDTALGNGWVRGDRLGDEYFFAEDTGKKLNVTPFFDGELQEVLSQEWTVHEELAELEINFMNVTPEEPEAGEEFSVDVNLEELAGIETEDLTVSLAIAGTGIEETIEVDSLQGSEDTVTFDNLVIEDTGEYTIDVTADAGNADAVSSRITLSLEDFVDGIEITTQPDLEYTEGQELDLSDLVVTKSYQEADDRTVAFSDFADYGLTAEPGDGTGLSLEDDGQTIEVEHSPTENTAETQPLSVSMQEVENHFPTDYEQYMITLINRARLDPEAEADLFGIDLNQDISPEDEISPDMKQPLAFNPDLTQAAREHSQWMLDNDTFDHTGEGGSSVEDRIKDTDYNTDPPWGWGENLALTGYTEGMDELIAQKHENLFHSSGHRENTMRESFMEVGVGSLLGDYTGDTGYMTTVKFAHTSDTPFLTGTVFQDLDGSGAYKPGEGLGDVQVQAGEQVTATWDSGGYAMQLEPGDYLLTFNHDEFEEKVEMDFTMPDENVLVDLVLEPDDLQNQTDSSDLSIQSIVITPEEPEAGQEFTVDVSIEELAGVETENLTVNLEINDTDIDETKYVDPLQETETTVSFEDLVIYEVGEYIIEVTTDADNASQATQTKEFAILEEDASQFLTVTEEQLRGAASGLIDGDGSFAIVHEDIEYTFEDSEYNIDTSQVADMSGIFAGTDFNGDIGYWDVSNVDDMRSMFFLAESFNQDIGDWDVSNVQSMSSMFSEAGSFNQDIGDWVAPNVQDMSSMFVGARNFNQNIGDWDVSNVDDMKAMFLGAEAFNQDIGDWEVSNVTNMKKLFENAGSFNQDLGDWETSSVQDMSYMFQDAESFDQDIVRWDVFKVQDMRAMFWGAETFDQDIGEWETSSVQDMSYMFRSAESFNPESFNQGIGGWDVSNVDDMRSMFDGAKSFNQNIGDWDVSNVQDMNMMFAGASSFYQDISGWHVPHIPEEPFGFAGGSPLAENEHLHPWGDEDDEGNSQAIEFMGLEKEKDILGDGEFI